MLDCGKTVHHDQVRHPVRVVHGGTERGHRTAIVAGHREPVMAQLRHQADHVESHGALARLGVAGLVRRERRPAVPPKIRSHHEVVSGKAGRNAVPGRVGPGMAVQQHDRGARAAVPDPQRHLADMDAIQLKILEQVYVVPAR
jgi:hypothetical protein